MQNVNHHNKWKGWKQDIRPKNSYGGGGKHPTAEFVDFFPMAEGRRNGESEYVYDKLCFFMNRDPRFYRTFAFPGIRWFHDGNTREDLATEKNDVQFEGGATMRSDYPYNGDGYVL